MPVTALPQSGLDLFTVSSSMGSNAIADVRARVYFLIIRKVSKQDFYTPHSKMLKILETFSTKGPSSNLRRILQNCPKNFAKSSKLESCALRVVMN